MNDKDWIDKYLEHPSLWVRLAAVVVILGGTMLILSQCGPA